VYTDHQTLVSSFIPYLKSQMKGILARWYLRLSQYLPNVTLKHKPDKVNRVADTLSQTPVLEVLQMDGSCGRGTSYVKDKEFTERSESELRELIDYLEEKSLPEDHVQARKIVIQAQKKYFLVDRVIMVTLLEEGMYLLQQEVLSKHHEAIFAGQFKFAHKKMYS